MQSEIKQIIVPVLNPTIDPINVDRELYHSVEVHYYTSGNEETMNHRGVSLVAQFENPFTRRQEQLQEAIPDGSATMEEKVTALVLNYFEYINPSKE